MTIPDHQNTEAARAPLLRTSSSSTLGSLHSDDPQYGGPEGSRQERLVKSLRRRSQLLRGLAFVSAVLSAFCAGSITVFSLYGHLFQSQLHYSQMQVNGVASAMSLSMYIPVPIVGYLCDRLGPGPLSLLGAILGGGGYALASGLYHKGAVEAAQGIARGDSTFGTMVFAFVAIGIGTASLYLSAITTCAKNFGESKYRGLMLVAPIASFGLAGMLLSQIGSKLLYETKADGSSGDVNVFHFFIFLCVLLGVIGFIGTFTLRIVNEEALIDGAVEEMERSGILQGSEIFRRQRERNGYGTLSQHDAEAANGGDMLDPNKNDDDEDEEEEDAAGLDRLKKAWLLNAETKRFLTDHTMWWYALGFWLIIGPGESFINNLGTVIGTLYPPKTPSEDMSSAATHVSIMATVSTVARLLAACLSDLLSPTPHSRYMQAGPAPTTVEVIKRKLSVSRITLFLVAGLITSFGTLFLASGAVQDHAPDRFWVVSGAIGAGYGAVFSLTPIIITMIWGVENFGTNFGIVALTPAIGAVMWGLIYSAVYQAGAGNGGAGGDLPSSPVEGGDDDVFCNGKQCYAPTFWAETISVWVGIFMVLWAWKGRNGWSQRGVVI